MFHADGERIFFMDRIISSFLEHLIVEKGFSRNTSDAYRNDLGQFWDFLQDHSTSSSNGNSNIDLNGGANESISRNPIWAEVDIDVLNKYIENLRIHKGYRDTTTARKIASIKSFFGFLAENSIISEDPTESLGSPRIGRTLPKFLPEDDVTKLLDTAYKSGTNESPMGLDNPKDLCTEIGNHPKHYTSYLTSQFRNPSSAEWGVPKARARITGSLKYLHHSSLYALNRQLSAEGVR